MSGELISHTSRAKLYTPPPPPLPPFLAKRHFPGEGGGDVYFEAPRGRNFIRPPFFTHPPPLEGYFQGWGGWGCIKFGPVIWPQMLENKAKLGSLGAFSFCSDIWQFVVGVRVSKRIPSVGVYKIWPCNTGRKRCMTQTLGNYKCIDLRRDGNIDLAYEETRRMPRVENVP